MLIVISEEGVCGRGCCYVPLKLSRLLYVSLLSARITGEHHLIQSKALFFSRFFKNYHFVYKYFACMCVCAWFPEARRRVLDFLGVELEMVVSHYKYMGIKLRSSPRATQVLLTADPTYKPLKHYSLIEWLIHYTLHSVRCFICITTKYLIIRIFPKNSRLYHSKIQQNCRLRTKKITITILKVRLVTLKKLYIN